MSFPSFILPAFNMADQASPGDTNRPTTPPQYHKTPTNFPRENKKEDTPHGKGSRHGSRAPQAAAEQQPLADDRNKNIVYHMRDKKAIIDYATLLDKFLPIPPGKDEPSPQDYSAALDFDSVPMQGLESGVYSPLVRELLLVPRVAR